MSSEVTGVPAAASRDASDSGKQGVAISAEFCLLEDKR